MTPRYSPVISSVARLSGTSLTVLAVTLVACSAEPAARSEDAPRSAAAQAATPQAAASSATLELGSDTYTFDRVTCDLDDSVDDDILVRGSGTAPDGRRISLEVERREVGDRLDDRVTVYFGSMVEGDHWNARASGQPGGSWATAIAGGEPLDGPLVVIEGSTLTAEGTFTHETRDESLEGSLRVTCDS